LSILYFDLLLANKEKFYLPFALQSKGTRVGKTFKNKQRRNKSKNAINLYKLDTKKFYFFVFLTTSMVRRIFETKQSLFS
jgi:hypothetical protein